MNKQELIKKLISLKKSEIAIDNAKKNNVYDCAFGIGYNKAIDDMINFLKERGI